MQYLYDGKPTGKPGRPKKYHGKVDHTNINMDYFTLESNADNAIINSVIVYSKSMTRNIKLVHVLYDNGKGKQT